MSSNLGVVAAIPWDAVGAIAGALAVALAIWQVRLAIAGRSNTDSDPIPFTSNSPPVARLPTVRGRDQMIRALEGRLNGAKAQILAGMGGVGRSTIALAICERASRPRLFWRRHVWWVPATNDIGRTASMLNIAQQPGASKRPNSWLARNIRHVSAMERAGLGNQAEASLS